MGNLKFIGLSIFVFLIVKEIVKVYETVKSLCQFQTNFTPRRDHLVCYKCDEK